MQKTIRKFSGYIVFSGYLICTLMIQNVILYSECLNPRQRLIDSLFIWVIPALWAVVLISMTGISHSRIPKKREPVYFKFQFTAN
jgi:hypothetical protein